MAAEPKAPYKLTIKLDTIKTEKLTEALTELREKLAEYDQSPAATTATITVEAWQEAPIRSAVDSFETWLYYHNSAIDVEVKLQRPGVRPETIAMLSREKRETPMDREFQKFADDNNVEISGTLLGKKIHATPGERAMEWLTEREQRLAASGAGDENLFEDE